MKIAFNMSDGADVDAAMKVLEFIKDGFIEGALPVPTSTRRIWRWGVWLD
jgi:hypothetical protein